MLNSKLFFIINPYATRAHHAEAKIRHTLNRYSTIDYSLGHLRDNCSVDTLITSWLPELRQGGIVVAVGGDGTISTIVNQLKQYKLDNPVGVLPAGSGNDFARSHQLPLGVQPGLNYLIHHSQPTALDCLRIESSTGIHYAINSCGVGIDGRVIHELSAPDPTKSFGQLAYLKSGIESLFHQQAFDVAVTVDGQTSPIEQTLLLVIANHGSFGGGIPILPQANPTDGLIDILYTSRLHALDLLQVVPQLLLGKHLNHSKVHSLRGHTIELTIKQPEFMQADGEPMGEAEWQVTCQLTKQMYLL